MYEENWYQKMQKLAFLGKNYEAVLVPKQGGTGTTIQKLIGTGTDTSGTGTTQQNQIGTGTEQSGIGTTVSKMPRLCSFAILSLNSCTDSIRTLMND